MRHVSAWRRIAIAAWDRANDPTVYGTLALDATAALEYLRKARAQSGVKVTMTHLVGRAIALALRETPDINGRIVGSSLYLRPTVDICFQVAMDDGRELSAAKIDRVDEKDAHEIAGELAAKAARIRARSDPQFEHSKRVVDRLPAFLLRPVLRLAAHLTSDRGWDLPSLKLPRDPFGSAMVTSVGMFGIDVGYAPIFPLANTPLLVLVGEVTDRPVAVNGEVVVRPMFNLSVTFDHRFIDGIHAGKMARSLRSYFSAPGNFEVTRLLPSAEPVPKSLVTPRS